MTPAMYNPLAASPHACIQTNQKIVFYSMPRWTPKKSVAFLYNSGQVLKYVAKSCLLYTNSFAFRYET